MYHYSTKGFTLQYIEEKRYLIGINFEPTGFKVKRGLLLDCKSPLVIAIISDLTSFLTANTALLNHRA